MVISVCGAGQPGTLSPGPFQQFNCVVNTVVSLLGAAVAAFVASSAYHGKFDMVRLHSALPSMYDIGFSNPEVCEPKLTSCHNRISLIYDLAAWRRPTEA